MLDIERIIQTGIPDIAPVYGGVRGRTLSSHKLACAWSTVVSAGLKQVIELRKDRSEDRFPEMCSQGGVEYFYYPMGGSRVATWRAYFNLFLCMLMVGIWHGASWAFVFWGSWNGLCLVFEKFTRLHKIQSHKFFVNFGLHIYTILCFLIARVFFISPNFNYAKDLVKNMAGILKLKEIDYGFLYYFDRITVIVSIISVICAMPLFKNILNWGQKNCILGLLVNIWIITLLILSCMQLAASTYNPFIYFRF